LFYEAAKTYTAFHHLKSTLLLDVFYKVKKWLPYVEGCDLVLEFNGHVSF